MLIKENIWQEQKKKEKWECRMKFIPERCCCHWRGKFKFDDGNEGGCFGCWLCYWMTVDVLERKVKFYDVINVLLYMWVKGNKKIIIRKSND
jgi:hypothetical protein